MSVFRECEVEWAGQKYKFVPSMSVIRSIEMQDISLAHVQWQIAQGKPQMSLMTIILGTCLRSAGAVVSDDDLYQELASSDPANVIDLYNSVMLALTPEPKEKKSEAQAT